jgi:hypothetical protein
MLRASAQAADFKGGRHFGEGQQSTWEITSFARIPLQCHSMKDLSLPMRSKFLQAGISVPE